MKASTVLILAAFALTGCLGATGKKDAASGIDGQNGPSYTYAGTWSGPMTLVYEGVPNSFSCTGDFVFSQPSGLFVMESGAIDCSGDIQTWPRTEVEDRNGLLFYQGEQFGTRTAEALQITLPSDQVTIYFELIPVTPTNMIHRQRWTHVQTNTIGLVVNGQLNRQ